MLLRLTTCDVRSWETSDVEPLARHANNRNIWLNLRDAFPYPYTKQHARDFIRTTRQRTPETLFAIAVDGEAIGGIGFVLHPDVERVSAEIGYWLGKPYWGRGIMTPAVKSMTRYAIDNFGLTRVFAVIGAHNTGSMRVLEKAGFVREGFLKQSSIKNGQIQDQYLYGFYA